jgi:hypothetical protein
VEIEPEDQKEFIESYNRDNWYYRMGRPSEKPIAGSWNGWRKTRYFCWLLPDDMTTLEHIAHDLELSGSFIVAELVQLALRDPEYLQEAIEKIRLGEKYETCQAVTRIREKEKDIAVRKVVTTQKQACPGCGKKFEDLGTHVQKCWVFEDIKKDMGHRKESGQDAC